MCLFDTSGDINDDDQLLSVFNVGTSIGKIGFCGDGYQKLWCLTHIETLSVWDWNSNIIEANFEDARALASESWTSDQIEYFVDCHFSEEENKLTVIGGTNAGSLAYFPVKYGSKGRSLGSAEAVFHGGHAGIVRSVLHVKNDEGEIFGWTGGEDGRLCCWRPDDHSSTSSSSWVSTALVHRSPKTRANRYHRYTPY